MSEVNNINNENSAPDSADDLWAEAFAEQTEVQQEVAQDEASKNFDMLEASASTPSISRDLDLVLDIPVKMTVQLGKTKMAIKDLLSLSQGSVVALDGLAGEPLDILINGYLIAQGEVVVVDDKYGIRITDIITPSERMRRLSQG